MNYVSPKALKPYVVDAPAIKGVRPQLDRANQLQPLGRVFAHFASEACGDVLQHLDAKIQNVRRRSELLSPGDRPEHVSVLQSGWGMSYKLLPDGSRHIVRFIVPGEIVGLRCLFLPQADHYVETLTTAVVAQIPRKDLIEAVQSQSRLGKMLVRAMGHSTSVLMERLVQLGQLGAYDRVGCLFLELLLFLRISGVAHGSSFGSPLTLELVADATGLSAIHTHRTLMQLREDGMVTFTRGQVTIHDVQELAEKVGFDGSYLERGAWRAAAASKRLA